MRVLLSARIVGCVLALLLWVAPVLGQRVGPVPPSSRLLARANAQFYTHPDSVLPLARRAEQLARAEHNPAQQGSAWNTIGAHYYTHDAYKPALQAYAKALSFFERSENDTLQASVLNNLGGLCLTMGLFESSFQYFERGTTLSLKITPDSSGDLTLYLRGSGVALAALHRFPEALDRYHRTLFLDRKAHDAAGEAATLGYIGLVYVKQQRYREAIQTLEKVQQMSAKLPDGLTDLEVLQGLGDAYKGLGQWAKAAKYYQARIDADPDRLSNQFDGYRQLAEVQYRAGDYRAAYGALKRFVGINDTLTDKESVQRAHDLETRYRTRDLQRANQIQQLTIARKNQLVAFGFGTAALVLLAAGGLGWLIVQRTRANRLLAAANAEISRTVAEKEALLTEKTGLLTEKEILIQEVHHRVKNNLQLVSSLLSWQAETNAAAAPALQQSRTRLHSMALIHEHLYRADDLARVRMDDYLGQLVQTLAVANHDSRQEIELITDLAPLEMEAQDAIPLGLITNELLTNVYKHAFRGRARGRLTITLARQGETGFRLQIADDGVGLLTRHTPEALRQLPSLGVQLIYTLTEQLLATYVIEPNEPTGTRFLVERA